MVVVTVFLIVEIPFAIVTLVHMLANLNIIQFEGDSYLNYINITVVICNFNIMLSYPLNFAIYCGMSAQFRNTFKTLLATLFTSNNSQVQQQQENTVSLMIVGDGTSNVKPNINCTKDKPNGTLIPQ